jgi:hypothetical protein
MATRTQRLARFGTLGFICSLVSVINAIAGLCIILPKLNLQDKMLELGTVRKPMAILAILLAVVTGLAAFLLGLEGTTSEDRKVVTRSWIGFWVGVAGSMIGIILGLLYWGYQY